MVMPIAANPQIAACEPSDIRLEMVKNTGILISTNTANSAIRIGVAFLNTRLFTGQRVQRLCDCQARAALDDYHPRDAAGLQRAGVDHHWAGLGDQDRETLIVPASPQSAPVTRKVISRMRKTLTPEAAIFVIASMDQLLRMFNVSIYLYNVFWGGVVLFTVFLTAPAAAPEPPPCGAGALLPELPEQAVSKNVAASASAPIFSRFRFIIVPPFLFFGSTAT